MQEAERIDTNAPLLRDVIGINRSYFCAPSTGTHKHGYFSQFSLLRVKLKVLLLFFQFLVIEFYVLNLISAYWLIYIFLQF